jgi:hypothetical protein
MPRAAIWRQGWRSNRDWGEKLAVGVRKEYEVGMATNACEGDKKKGLFSE